LSQEDITNLNRCITSNEIETFTKKLPRKKSPCPDGLIAEFYQTFKELTPLLLKLVHKTQKEGILPNSSTESVLSYYQNQVKVDQKYKVIGQYP
jgi:hypothetical protein